MKNQAEDITQSPKNAAMRLLNLFNQQHVIEKGIKALNQDFLNADESVIKELKNIPGGKKLLIHIEKLKSGETPKDSISKKDLPFGISVFTNEQTIENKTVTQTKQKPDPAEEIKENLSKKISNSEDKNENPASKNTENSQEPILQNPFKKRK